MSKRFTIGLAASALALALAGASASAASAHVVGDPYPTPSQQSTDYGRHHVRPVNWDWDLQASNFGPIVPAIVNRVDGRGAIPMDRWRLQNLTPNTVRFSLLGNSVRLLRTRLSLPTESIRTCTLTFNNIGAFRILDGTGIGANLRGQGTFAEVGLVSVPRIKLHRVGREVCPLLFLNPFQERAIIEQAGIGGLQPRFMGAQALLENFSAQGTAQVFRVRPLPVPYPTGGPGGYFAPTVSPTDATPLAA